MKQLHKYKHQQGAGIIKVIVLTPFVIMGLAVLFFIYTEINKAYWDHQVKELCEKDGGVTVYEVVHLTKEEYLKNDGRNGSIRVPPETASYASKYSYLYNYKKKFINKSNPSVYRWESVIYRKIDNKKFGKVVSYHRGGGDFPTIIGHPSGFDCNDMNIKLNVIQQIFKIKEQ